MTNIQYVSREVKVEWQGQEHLGKVVENFRERNGARRWRVKFDDGYVRAYKEPDRGEQHACSHATRN